MTEAAAQLPPIIPFKPTKDIARIKLEVYKGTEKVPILGLIFYITDTGEIMIRRYGAKKIK